MRKQKLLDQNVQLFEQLQQARLEIGALKKQISQNQVEIERLNTVIKSLNEKEETVSFPLKHLEEKVAQSVSLDSDEQYGAQVIGRIVVNAAEYSNRLTSGGETKYKELVNLILGRTEVAKSEILGVVSSQNDIETKKREMDEIEKNASEYFENVMAQK